MLRPTESADRLVHCATDMPRVTTVKEYIEDFVHHKERSREHQMNVKARAHVDGHIREQERGGVEVQHSQRALLPSQREEKRSEPNRDAHRSVMTSAVAVAKQKDST